MTLVPSFLALVQFITPSMTTPTLVSLKTLLAGWVFCGRRTVTGMIVAAGAIEDKHHSAYHRVFAAARWSLDTVGLSLFRLLLALVPEGVIALTLDDTLARKRGLKVYGAGMHHDPLQSSRKKAIVSWGHSWVVLALRVQLPFLPGRFFSLPVLFRLYLNHKACGKWRVAHRTRPELAGELLRKLCGVWKQKRFHLYADSSYGGQSVLAHLPPNCDLTSRLPLDARLHERAPVRQPGATGRPRIRGKRLPSPQQMLLNERASRVTLNLYGRQDRVRLVETAACWFSVPHRLLKVVAVEPLTGGRQVQAFYSTCADASAVEVLTGYSGRWSIEEAIEGSKQHLGFEEPQGWSKRAVLRTAPFAMVLYSLVIFWFAQQGHTHYVQPHRPWYRKKKHPSFYDMLQTLRSESLRATLSALPSPGHPRQNPVEPLIHAVLSAA
jgi:hypothetical protein